MRIIMILIKARPFKTKVGLIYLLCLFENAIKAILIWPLPSRKYMAQDYSAAAGAASSAPASGPVIRACEISLPSARISRSISSAIFGLAFK